MTLGLTTHLTLTCPCGEEWSAEACMDLGACDLLDPADAICPECGEET